MKTIVFILAATFVATVLPATGAAKTATDGGNVEILVVRDGNAVNETSALPRTRLSASEAAVRKSGKAYLGVHVTPVPAAVASQLRLGHDGAMIENVVKGSPADQAGLRRYDVIASLGDKDAVAVKGIEPFVEAVRGRKAGETLTLGIIRGGKKRAVKVTMAKPGEGAFEYKYANDPDNELLDEVRVHRGTMRKKGGVWVMGTPDGLSVRLPSEALDALPEALRGRFLVRSKVLRGDDTLEHSVTRVGDGQSLRFHKSADGKITVTRTGQEGKSEKAVYDSIEQLKARDPEAYRLFAPYCDEHRREGDGFGLRIEGRPLSELGKETAQAAEEFNRKFEQRIRAIAEQMDKQAGRARVAIAKAVAPTTRKFDVDETGRIRVQVLRDGDELNMTFANEAEMKAKSPKLYEQYKKMVEGK